MMVATAVGATPQQGDAWFSSLHEREEAGQWAQREGVEAARALEEHDKLLGAALSDADTAARATARLRHEVSAQIAQWQIAQRKADRVALLGESNEGRAMWRALEMSQPEASKKWQTQVELLQAVEEGRDQAGELMLRRGELTIILAQHRAQEATAQSEREALLKSAQGRAEREAIEQELERTARDLSAQMAGAAKNPTTEDFHRRKGALVPPIPGRPDVPFGPRAQQNSQSFVRHTGLTYQVEPGREVRSVGAGLVIFAGRMPGYGQLLIVDHGGGYHSLYAHLEQVEPALGEHVQNRQVLGSTGESGSLEGPKFYFELRESGVPIDPKPWFVSQ